MQKLVLISLFLIQIIKPIFPTHLKSEKSRKFLHVSEEVDTNKPIIIENKNHDLVEALSKRYKRDLTDHNEGFKNITTKQNPLNDSHAQLMVHWLGENTDVMICLARDPPIGPNDDPQTTITTPSTIFISYDYGDTFIDKTESFQLNKSNNIINSTVDLFVTHPKFNTIVFTDTSNNAIFKSHDYGKTIVSKLLDFKPSDVSFYESDARTFLILDKDDPQRKLYITTDFGESFELLQSYVKSFVWSSGDGVETHLYVERREPTNTSSIIFINAADLLKDGRKKFHLLIENVQEFYVKKDFMFATQKSLNTTKLLISYRREAFVKAEFITELDLRGIHIADVEGKRILVSAIHNEKISHLYVSEMNEKMTDIKFVMSLENIFTFMPELNWRSSWLTQSADEPFTDLYKVEGLRGIYIASRIIKMPNTDAISPDSLGSVISFDHGSTWNPLIAPTVDDEGQAIICKDCSLHLSQKFSQLYPVTRSVTIMSSRSAPGVIMASGVIGKSLKGHPGVFISRDAGLTWKQILKNYHFFNMGDHGGILVAVKYFKSKGETREILYSTDEGDKWLNYSFHSADLKVYGLMTEPNSNSTIFTLFGSEVNEHRWLIIKIDLKNAFTSNCTEDDYKFWVPRSHNGDSFMPCILGKQDTYQRRKAHANCHNGVSYVRPIRQEVCYCSKWDYDCDAGFTRLSPSAGCVRNKTISNFDPYAVPSFCKPGLFYNRTKGYKKIEGDECINGFSSLYEPQSIPCPFKSNGEFIVVAQRDRISKINLADGVKEIFPVTGLKNVIAIEFDLANNCVFWADIMSDVIGRQCLNGTEAPEILVETGLASVEGMSYDWISKMLYFVDGMRLKIEAVRISSHPHEKMRRTVIPSAKLAKPRGIAVHPMAGYLFWTDWNAFNPSVSRANLDGEDRKELFIQPEVFWPNGITIDFIAERIYWVDASKDYIASSDLNGKSFMRILHSDTRVEHPFAVAVHKELMYWSDWKMSSVFSADKDHGIMIRTVAEEMVNLMDIKLFAHGIQEGSNGCSGKHGCSHFCVGAPKNTYKCLCPDGMHISSNGKDCLCPDDQKPFQNNSCAQSANTCAPRFFNCQNKLCIPLTYRCDGEDDCGDKSDEVGCASDKPACPPHMFTCVSDQQCIPEYFACDFEKDCSDGSDEANCKQPKCKDNEFTCDNKRCISKKWVCDKENDCRDGSDERNCGLKNQTQVTCKDEEFKCLSTGACIPLQWKCDSDNDCPDASDETNCNRNTSCDPWMFSCGDGKCIYKTWMCDGEPDCADKSDEANCTATIDTSTSKKTPINFDSNNCQDWMFRCANAKCVPYWWKCDSVNDCGDGSDERGCGRDESDSTIIIQPTESPKPQKCDKHEFRCDTGICISRRYVCDGYADCGKGEDEENCPANRASCASNEFRCKSDGNCMAMEKYCDGIRHCADGSDEDSCTYKTNATSIPNVDCKNKPGLFYCDDTCFPLMKVCDMAVDCLNGADEENCHNKQRVYQVVSIGVNERMLDATSFLIYWWIAVPQNLTFEYLPSIYSNGVWKNVSEWLNQTDYRFTSLDPYTLYNVTVYVRIKGTSVEFVPYLYYEVATAEGVPTEPINVSAIQVNGSRVQVSWSAPIKPNGHLEGFSVYYRSQNQRASNPQIVKVSAAELSLIIESAFEGNMTYEFWVKAKNRKNEGLPSKVVWLLYDSNSNIDSITGMTLKNMDKKSMTLSWNKIEKAEGYIVQLVLPHPYPKIEPIKTQDTSVTISNLVNGAQYVARVSAYVRNYTGRSQSLVLKRNGAPLPEIQGIQITKEEDNIRLSWQKPKIQLDPNEKLSFGIYYGTNLEELFDLPKHKTQETSILLTNLNECQSYLVGVGIVGPPSGPGPLGKNPRTVETHFSEKKPPKNLSVSFDDVKHTMDISWEHSCSLPSSKYPNYIITLREITLNQTARIKVSTKSNFTLSHTFHDIPRGAKYEIQVSTDVKDSNIANITATAMPLPAPRLMSIYPEKNGSYVVAWKEVKDMGNEKFIYQVVIRPGIGTKNENHQPIITLDADQPPILVHPSHLSKGDVLSPGQIFNIGVRLKTKRGIYSDIGDTEIFEVQPDAFSPVAGSSSSSMWLFVLSLFVIAAMGGVIMFLIQRHRRLQNSFSRFANSHYDTKTGATRIGDALDDDDLHQEVPSAFSHADDEPLVIT